MVQVTLINAHTVLFGASEDERVKAAALQGSMPGTAPEPHEERAPPRMRASWTPAELQNACVRDDSNPGRPSRYALVDGTALILGRCPDGIAVYLVWDIEQPANEGWRIELYGQVLLHCSDDSPGFPIPRFRVNDVAKLELL